MYLPEGVFGEISDTNGTFLWMCGEHAYQANGSVIPKVPPGEYICQLGEHQLEHMTEPFKTFQLMSVPGHDNILIHVGNYPQIDSQGCLIIGLGIGLKLGGKEKMITGSRQAFNDFMTQQAVVTEFRLTVE